MNQVYRPSKKALSKNVFDSSDRLIFLGDGTAVMFNGDRLVVPDLLYKRPDSHVVVTTEPIPRELKVSKQQLEHIKSNGIKLPFDLVD